MVVVYDVATEKMTHYSSTDQFSLMAAHKARELSKQPENINKFEKFTNQDYNDVCQKDFREVRYKKKNVQSEPEDQMELEYFSSLQKRQK